MKHKHNNKPTIIKINKIKLMTIKLANNNMSKEKRR